MVFHKLSVNGETKVSDQSLVYEIYRATLDGDMAVAIIFNPHLDTFNPHRNIGRIFLPNVETLCVGDLGVHWAQIVFDLIAKHARSGEKYIPMRINGFIIRTLNISGNQWYKSLKNSYLLDAQTDIMRAQNITCSNRYIDLTW